MLSWGSERARRTNSWTRASALYGLANVADAQFTDDVVSALSMDSPLVRETAVFTLAKLSPDAFHKHKRKLLNDHDKRVVAAVNRMRDSEREEVDSMLTVERVMVLKTVSIFSETTEQVLADIVPVLEEVDIQAGEILFKKGDLGNCMYVINDGKVRIHHGETTYCELGPREIFGEMTALDPEPRSATVTAIEDTRLLQLDQETLLDLMANRTEIVRGVIHVLCQRLRAKDAL